MTKRAKPWPTGDQTWALDVLLGPVGGLANYPKPEELSGDVQRTRNRLRSGLQMIVDEKPPILDGVQSFEIPIALRLQKNGAVEWAVRKPKLRKNADKLDSRTESALFGILAWLWSDERRKRLRKCDWCVRFYLQKGNHRRDHSFCTYECRRRFDLRNRDPEKHREYMQSYRNVKKKQREAKRKK